MTNITIDDKLAELIDAHHTSLQAPPRAYLGGSIIGHECDRWLWLNFRWAVREQFPGRIKRLFRRGQNEENTVVADLRDVGMTVSDCLHNQKHYMLTPHIGCTPDGLLTGHPDEPKAKHSLEIKTHILRSFNEVVKGGVEKAKPMHYAQMQCEMTAQGTERALYIAICKDDDRIYTERVRLDKQHAEAIIERGKRIVFADRIPEPMAGAGPSWYKCKQCAGHDFCHESKLTKEANCRTCCHWTAAEDGRVMCELYGAEIPSIEAQLAGCDSHILHPDLTPWSYEVTERNTIIFDTPEGKVENGEPCANIFASREIVANWKTCAKRDPLVDEMREVFSARVIG